MSAWYNENDPEKAAWIRELIRRNIVAPGDVDERSITDVRADDLRGYKQCHFFAGIAVWSYALRLAGWPDDRQCWTGSCPCPSFSTAGKGQGFDDPRHLWPDWYRLIPQRRPPAIFGEQSDDAIDFGWLDLVQTDLEKADYAVGKAVLATAGVGGPCPRERVYFVGKLAESETAERRRAGSTTDNGGGFAQTRGSGHGDRMACTNGNGYRAAHTVASEQNGHVDDGHESRWFGANSERSASASSILNGYWQDADWVLRKKWNSDDSEWCPTEPGSFPLVAGAPARVLRLRGYGDAINAEVAKAFIEAAMSTGDCGVVGPDQD